MVVWRWALHAQRRHALRRWYSEHTKLRSVTTVITGVMLVTPRVLFEAEEQPVVAD